MVGHDRVTSVFTGQGVHYYRIFSIANPVDHTTLAITEFERLRGSHGRNDGQVQRTDGICFVSATGVMMQSLFRYYGRDRIGIPDIRQVGITDGVIPCREDNIFEEGERQFHHTIAA